MFAHSCKINSHSLYAWEDFFGEVGLPNFRFKKFLTRMIQVAAVLFTPFLCGANYLNIKYDFIILNYTDTFDKKKT